MFGLSLEHILLAAVVLLFFGPKTLPGAASALGKAMRGFREQMKGIREPEFRRVDEVVIETSQKDPHA